MAPDNPTPHAHRPTRYADRAEQLYVQVAALRQELILETGAPVSFLTTLDAAAVALLQARNDLRRISL